MQRHLLPLHHPDRESEPALDREQRVQHLPVQLAPRDGIVVQLAHRTKDVVDPLGRAELAPAAAPALNRRHRQIVREAVKLKRRPAQRAIARHAELEEQRQVARIHPRRAQRLAAAEPDPPQVAVGDLHRLIRPVVHRPVRRRVAADQEPAKPRLVHSGKIEIEHGAEGKPCPGRNAVLKRSIPPRETLPRVSQGAVSTYPENRVAFEPAAGEV